MPLLHGSTAPNTVKLSKLNSISARPSTSSNLVLRGLFGATNTFQNSDFEILFRLNDGVQTKKDGQSLMENSSHIGDFLTIHSSPSFQARLGIACVAGRGGAIVEPSASWWMLSFCVVVPADVHDGGGDRGTFLYINTVYQHVLKLSAFGL